MAMPSRLRVVPKIWKLSHNVCFAARQEDVSLPETCVAFLAEFLVIYLPPELLFDQQAQRSSQNFRFFCSSAPGSQLLNSAPSSLVRSGSSMARW